MNNFLKTHSEEPYNIDLNNPMFNFQQYDHNSQIKLNKVIRVINGVPAMQNQAEKERKKKILDTGLSRDMFKRFGQSCALKSVGLREMYANLD